MDTWRLIADFNYLIKLTCVRVHMCMWVNVCLCTYVELRVNFVELIFSFRVDVGFRDGIG